MAFCGGPGEGVAKLTTSLYPGDAAKHLLAVDLFFTGLISDLCKPVVASDTSVLYFKTAESVLMSCLSGSGSELGCCADGVSAAGDCASFGVFCERPDCCSCRTKS